jgi:hypothetical protein
MWSRKRIGKKGFLFVHLSQVPSLICENISDMVVVGESSNIAEPGNWDPEYYFLPITQKLAGKWGMTGKSAPFAAMSGMLEGFPLGTGLPMNKTEAVVYREYRLFAGVDMSKYKLMKASEKPVNTGVDGVWANLYFSEAGALIYAANLTEKKALARISVDLSSYGLKGNLSIETVRNELPAPMVNSAQKKTAAKKLTESDKQSAKQRGANVAPEPENDGQERFEIWTNLDIDNGKVLKEKFTSSTKELKEGVDCELPPLMSVLFKIKLVK